MPESTRILEIPVEINISSVEEMVITLLMGMVMTNEKKHCILQLFQ